MNIASIIEAHEATRPALIDDDQTISYGELQQWSAAVRTALVAREVSPNDRVIIVAGNEPLFVPCLLGVMGVGARAIPVPHTNPFPELQRKLATLDPALVLVCADARWLLDHADAIGVPCVDVTELDLSMPADPASIVDCEPDHIALMMLTSGVSGDAKTAMLTHANLEWAQENLAGEENNRLVSTDVVLASLPVSHIFGLNAVLMTALRAGARSVLQRRFDVDASLDLIATHGISVLAGAPPMWRRWSMLDAPPGTFSTVRIAVSGAAALSKEVQQRMFDAHGVTVEEGYGMTETAATITNNRGHDVRPGSVGKPIGDIELVLVEPDGTPVEPGDSGEIVVRGTNIFAGYFDSPEKTELALTESGWFWTGDVGLIDADGYVYIVDRVKDLIIVSGFNVYPAEVETVLKSHSSVTGAIAIGEPDEQTDETVVAYVTGNVDAEQLMAFSHEQLSRYKCPTRIHVVDELPIAMTGKPIRRELRS